MVKPEQVLTIEPENELRFKGPFTGGVQATTFITLRNPTNHKVYFKIKTTAPKRYCVRPNSGIIRPKNFTQIIVTLQTFDFEPTEKNRHKFMVQALIAPDNEDEDEFTDVWRDPNPDRIMESKLKCVFENPVTYTTSTATITSTTTTKSEANTNNGKNKASGDGYKIYVSSKQVLEDVDEKLKLLEATEEVNQLRVEESSLRQENIQLKEDILKLQKEAYGNDALAATRATIPRNSKGLISRNSSQCPPPNVIIISIAMIIIGYLIGKMF